MFYMGGMTLGYFSPHPVDVCEGKSEGQVALKTQPARLPA